MRCNLTFYFIISFGSYVLRFNAIFQHSIGYTWRPVLIVEEEPRENPPERTTDSREATDKLSHIPTLAESETRTHADRGQQEGDIRLRGIGSFNNQGRIEVYHAKEWGTVCDDAFGEVDAKVLCMQLGYYDGGVVMNSSVFGIGTGQIWMDDVTCFGTERKLIDCLFSNWGNNDCTHDEDVGVRCNIFAVNPTPAITMTHPPIKIQPSNCAVPDTNVRIVGYLLGSGVVEVNNNDQWGTICDDSWSIYNAQVICRMYCYDSSEAQAGSPTSSSELLNTLNPIRLDDVQCLGNETSIFDCPARPWNEQNCGPTDWAKVSCLRLNRSPLAAPLPLLQCTTGRFTARFSRSRDPFLEPKHLSIGMVYSGTCVTNKTLDPNYVIIIIPFNECGTLATTNVSHIYYENLIRYNSTNIEGNIVRGNTYMITVLCEFPKYVLNQQPIIPLTERVTQRAPGQLAVNLIFYQNNSFTNPVTQSPLQLTLGEYIYAMLILSDTSHNIRLVVSNCIATPSTNKSDSLQYPLFQNKCEKDPTVAFFPLNNTMFGFWYKTFKFVNFDTVYIHCDGLLCLVSETSAVCDRSCNATDRNRRRRRHSFHGVETSFHVSSAPVYVFSEQDNEPNRRENDLIRLAPLPTTILQSIITSGSPQHTPGGLFFKDSLDKSGYTSAERKTTVKTTAVLIWNPISLSYSQPPAPLEANVKHTSMLRSNHVISANGLTCQNDQSNLHDHDSFAVRATGNRGDYSRLLLVSLATIMMHLVLTIYLI